MNDQSVSLPIRRPMRLNEKRAEFDFSLQKEVLQDGGEQKQQDMATQGHDRPSETNPKVGVIYNPRSHRNLGKEPVLEGLPDALVAYPQEREDIAVALADFAAQQVNFLVISGGDGTVRDVLSAGQAIFGDMWPALAVLPRGKTNALNVDLGAPSDWRLADAVKAFTSGSRKSRRPIKITAMMNTAPICTQPSESVGDREEGAESINSGNDRAETDSQSQLGFILGAGGFTTGILAGQDAHRMGAFNSLAVIVTAIWGVAQAFFGSKNNIWRRGTRMRLSDPADGRNIVSSTSVSQKMQGVAKGMPGVTLGETSGDTNEVAGGVTDGVAGGVTDGVTGVEAEAESVLEQNLGDTEEMHSFLLASTLDRFPMGVKIFGPFDGALKITLLDRPSRRVLAMVPLLLSGYVPQWVQRAGFHQIAAQRFNFEIEERYVLDGEAYPPGSYRVENGPELSFVIP